MFSSSPQILLPAFGFIFLSLGITASLGYWKAWFLQTGGAPYGLIPLGVIILLYGFYDQLKVVLGASTWAFAVLVVALVAVAVWWSLRPPDFVKPRWVRWVEKYPPAVTDAMRRSAKTETGWINHVTSEADVDAWAKTFNGRKNNKKGKPA